MSKSPRSDYLHYWWYVLHIHWLASINLIVNIMISLLIPSQKTLCKWSYGVWHTSALANIAKNLINIFDFSLKNQYFRSFLQIHKIPFEIDVALSADHYWSLSDVSAVFIKEPKHKHCSLTSVTSGFRRRNTSVKPCEMLQWFVVISWN